MKRISLLPLLGALFLSGTANAQQTQCVSNALAGGTVDAIVIPLQPCALSTNILILTLVGANTISAPTLRMSGVGGALPILTSTGTVPGVGALPGAGAVIMLTSTGTAWKIVSGNASTIFSGTLTVPNGGTGDSLLASNGVLIGQGTAPVAVTAVGTTGTFLGGNTGAAPTFKSLTGSVVSSLSLGSTGLLPSTATTGAVVVTGTLAVASGGTGQTAFTNGQLLIGNTGTGGLSKATLTAGANTTITNSAGGITIASSGVGTGCGTSGSVGQVLLDDGAGGCTSSSVASVSGGVFSATGTGTFGTGLANTISIEGHATEPRVTSSPGGTLRLNGGNGFVSIESSGNRFGLLSSTGDWGLGSSGAVSLNVVHNATADRHVTITGGTSGSGGAALVETNDGNLRLTPNSGITELYGPTYPSLGVTNTSVAGANTHSWQTFVDPTGLFNVSAAKDDFSASTLAYTISRGSTYNVLNHLWYTSTVAGTPVLGMTLAANSFSLSAGQTSINFAGIQSSGGALSYVCVNSATGAITYGAGSGLCTASNENRKDILSTISSEEGLRLVLGLKPLWARYKYTETGTYDHAVHPMLGAQQVEGVDNRLAAYSPEGKLSGVRYMELTAVLVAALQEQQKEIDQLKLVLGIKTRARTARLVRVDK